MIALCSLFGYGPKNDTIVIILSYNKTDNNNLIERLISWISEPEKLTLLNMHQEKLTWSLTKKLIKENESLKHAVSYNEAHPEPATTGYRPFAITLYDLDHQDLVKQTTSSLNF